MRLTKVAIEGFRCYKGLTECPIDNITALIGRNDAGKSTILDALDVFFNQTAPATDDACVHSTDKTVRITCTFSDLPESLILDADHPTTLKKEYLLNSEGHLEVTKVYNCSLKTPKCTDVLIQAEHPTTTKYDDLLTLAITKLKARANELGVSLDDVNQTISTEIRRAIWKHADDLGLQVRPVSVSGTQTKSIWDQLSGALPVYALFKSDRQSTDQDDEAQDPMKAAIKEAIKAQESDLEAVTRKVEEQVQAIADRTVAKIADMDPGLASTLKPVVDRKSWDSIFKVSLTGDEGVSINRRGSGTRRLVLLNFFRAQVETKAADGGSGIIYAIEEPETSQHPNNQLMLLEALTDLADRDDCQVLLTTHTPVLAARIEHSSLRYITPNGTETPTLHRVINDDVLREVSQTLGVLPDHKIKAFLGVEGPNDIQFFRTISKMLHDAGEADIPDLAQAEGDGVLMFVPLGGSCLDLWITRLERLWRPEFYVFDRDYAPPKEPHYKAQAERIAARAGECTAWHTTKRELENYIHKDAIVAEQPNYAGTGDDFEDVPQLFAQAVHETGGSSTTWADILENPPELKKGQARRSDD